MVLLGVRLKWKLVSVHLEIVLVLVKDRCTVYAKHTIGSEIILAAPDGTPRLQGSSGSSFGPFGDCGNLNAR
jgi:hypothetical protein